MVECQVPTRRLARHGGNDIVISPQSGKKSCGEKLQVFCKLEEKICGATDIRVKCLSCKIHKIYDAGQMTCAQLSLINSKVTIFFCAGQMSDGANVLKVKKSKLI